MLIFGDMYHKVASRLFMKGKFDAYVHCTVTFDQKSSKLNSRLLVTLRYPKPANKNYFYRIQTVRFKCLRTKACPNIRTKMVHSGYRE